MKPSKTFVATWRPAGGAIRVVLVEEPTGWRADFSTDVAARGADVLDSVANRFALEIAFRDVKDVVGAGPQPTRSFRIVRRSPCAVSFPWGIAIS